MSGKRTFQFTERFFRTRKRRDAHPENLCSEWKLLPQPAESHDVDCLACLAVQPASFVALRAWIQLCNVVCLRRWWTRIDDNGQSRVNGGCRVINQDTNVFEAHQSILWFAGLLERVGQCCPFLIGVPYRAYSHVSREADLALLPDSGTLRRAPSSVPEQRVCQRTVAVCTPHLSTMARHVGDVFLPTCTLCWLIHSPSLSPASSYPERELQGASRRRPTLLKAALTWFQNRFNSPGPPRQSAYARLSVMLL